tara:strand:- start:1100 stop:1456 length:357 start_codon:yes stop_codon:yes gene_type:complete
MNNQKPFPLKQFEDFRGTLTVLEDEIPFPIKRIYWIHGKEGELRGGHRHIKTRQGLIAINGEIEVFMRNKTEERTYLLNKPSKCLLVEPEDWHTMKFTNNGILLVIASHKYDEKDYLN